MANPMTNNPNATVAAGSSGVGVLVVWLLGYFGVDLTAELGAVIAGALSSVVLWIGRDGIKGVLGRIWKGDKKDPEPPPVVKKPEAVK